MERRNFEYRIYPSNKQVARLERSFLLAKDMYNILLEMSISTYQNEGRRLTKFDMCRYIKVVKDNNPEFGSAYAQMLQNCADRLSKAFDNFFRRVKEKKSGKKLKVGFPRFKSSFKSITYPQDGFKLEPRSSTLYVSKIGNVPIVVHRPMGGQVKTMTIARKRSGRWFVVFSCIIPDAETSAEATNSRPEVGMDVGIRTFATLSNGCRIERPEPSSSEEKRLRRLQRRLDRKEIGGRNREKARLRFARAKEAQTDRNHDFLHKVSRQLVQEYGIIAAEDLAIKEMICSSPCPDDINRSSWGMLIRMLEYKAESAGAQIMFVDRYDPTSQICSGCERRGQIGRRETVFRCRGCGLAMDRDLNAAKNIIKMAKDRAGHARIDARGDGASTSHIIEMRAPSLNQELHARRSILAEIPIS